MVEAHTEIGWRNSTDRTQTEVRETKDSGVVGRRVIISP